MRLNHCERFTLIAALSTGRCLWFLSIGARATRTSTLMRVIEQIFAVLPPQGIQIGTHRAGGVCVELQVAENLGGLNRSMQHWLAVYSRVFQSPRSFAGVE
jgi:hypothetical protein